MARLLALVTALCLLGMGCAVAETYEGVTAALSEIIVTADASGTVFETAAVGARVEEGEALAHLKGEVTFADQDGVVRRALAKEGDSVSGAVLELAPMERYIIYCSVDRAYERAENLLIHSGETLYVKCSADGSHRAAAVVTQVDGDEFRALTVAGELYVGETVYLYRGDDFQTVNRVGIGTVLVNDTFTLEADGALTRLWVAEGDGVERGERLFQIGGGQVTAPAAGILIHVSAAPGDALREGDEAARIVPLNEVGVEVQVDESDAARLRVGDTAEVSLADRAEDAPLPAQIAEITATDEAGTYRIRLRLQNAEDVRLGMSATVWM